jgi:hypothetical protein
MSIVARTSHVYVANGEPMARMMEGYNKIGYYVMIS